MAAMIRVKATAPHLYIQRYRQLDEETKIRLECGPMLNVMAALSSIGGALCSTL